MIGKACIFYNLDHLPEMATLTVAWIIPYPYYSFLCISLCVNVYGGGGDICVHLCVCMCACSLCGSNPGPCAW